MNEYEARKFAREDLARAIYQHEMRKGQNPLFDECAKKAEERADICDKRKDWNIKEGK